MRNRYQRAPLRLGACCVELFPQDRLDALIRLVVHAGRRLVQQHQLAAAYQRAAQRQHLSLAVAEVLASRLYFRVEREAAGHVGHGGDGAVACVAVALQQRRALCGLGLIAGPGRIAILRLLVLCPVVELERGHVRTGLNGLEQPRGRDFARRVQVRAHGTVE